MSYAVRRRMVGFEWVVAMGAGDTPGTPVCSEVSRRTPVRDGDRYCSPACGLGCTWDAYLRATSAANDLCSMLGEGWKPVVWENLGWHYRAERGSVTVGYWAGNGGKAPPRFTCSYDGPGRQFHADSEVSPNEAVAEVRRQVEEEVEAMRRGLVSLVADGVLLDVAGDAPTTEGHAVGPTGVPPGRSLGH